MIVVDATCDQGHTFEGWFRSADEFARQCESGLVECPICGSTRIVRRPSAAYLASGRTHAPKPSDPATLARLLAAHMRAMAAGATDVGERFPEEARRIHRGESDQHSVRGKATRDELEDLLDEGIAVLPVPGDDDLH